MRSIFYDPREITSRDAEGRYHGYQEWYDEDMPEVPPCRFTMKNATEVGYDENSWVKQTIYHIR